VIRVDVVPLTVVGTELEAEMLCGMLRTNGVECSQQRTDRSAAVFAGTLGGAGPIEVLVGEADLERARELLASSG
jgi:hypothetical protein